MEILGFSIVKLSLIIGASIFAIIVYFIGRKQAKDKILKEYNEALEKAVDSADRDAIDIQLRKLRENK